MAIKMLGQTGPDPGHWIVGTATNMVADVARVCIDVREIEYIGIQFTWTGAAVGTLTIEGCNDYVPNVEFPLDSTKAVRAGSWTDATAYFDTITQPSNNARTELIQSKVPYCFKYIAVGYTHSSSTGRLDVYGNGKGV